MNVSSYLAAIQSLKGTTLRTKYNELHSIATKVLENDEEKKMLLDANTTDRVPSPLVPLLRTLVAMRLKSKEAVLEALKSDDVTIIRLGLNAKWFFNAFESLIDANYFVTNVIPFISLQTRLELIKKLSQSLKTDPNKANEFFEKFIELYGVNQVMPLLLACSDDYIYQQILKRKMVLPPKYLKYLYFRRPQAAIQYLQLGNEKNANNQDDRNVHKIKLSDYTKILPILIKNHTQEFVELFKCLDETWVCYQKKLGVKRAKVFIKNAKEVLSFKPRIFLPILPLKLVSKKLSKQEFDAMFQNLFPTEMENHNFYQLLKYLEYYPKEQVYELFSEKYKAAYGKDLLDYKNFLDNSFVKDILPLNMRIECYKDYIKDNPDRVALLQPTEAISLLKEKIDKTTSEDMKNLYISYMIYSCRLYEDKKSLLKVLKYYNEHLKNEPAIVLQSFLERLSVQIDLITVTEEHWYILGEITHRGHVKGDLFVKTGSELELPMYLKVAMQFFLKRCNAENVDERDRCYLDMFISIVLEGFCEQDLKWQFVPKILEIEKLSLQKFLLAVPKKYPENHAVWNQIDNKLKLSSYLISSMNQFNKRASNGIKMSIKYYSWLMHFVQNLLTIRDKVSNKLKSSYACFENSLRQHDYDLYQNLIDDNPQLINNVTTDDALVLLKKSPCKILDKLDLYLSACKRNVGKSKAVKRFIASTKWYQEIPVKIAEQCLEEKADEYSLLILGVLLEGKAFGQVIKPYLPKDSELDLSDRNIIIAFKFFVLLPSVLSYTNPPLKLDVLAILCEDDYLSLATKIFMCITKRTPLNKLLNFANQLVNQSNSAKKLALHLLLNVAPISETIKFISQMCSTKQRADVKKVMLKMTFDLFTQSPSEETWQLTKHFIDGSTPDDQEIFEVLKNLKAVNYAYIVDYIRAILQKIECFTDKMSKFLRLVLEKIDENVLKKLPEDMITDIITKNFFACPLDFLINVYLFSDTEKFESRLKLITNTLSEILSQLYKSDSKKTKIHSTTLHSQGFFSKKLFQQLMKNEDDSKVIRLLTSLLEIAPITADLVTIIELNFYKIYFGESDPTVFGEKCCKNAKELVKLFNSDYVVNYYGDTMRSTLQRTYSCNSNKFKFNKFKGKELDIIDGFRNHDDDLSVLIGVKLLNQSRVCDYDERYADFINLVKKIGDSMAKAVLNEFLAGINDILE